MDKDGIIQLRTYDNVGMEGTARFVFTHVNGMIKKGSDNRAWLQKIEVRENEKNSAIYEPVKR